MFDSLVLNMIMSFLNIKDATRMIRVCRDFLNEYLVIYPDKTPLSKYGLYFYRGILHDNLGSCCIAISHITDTVIIGCNTYNNDPMYIIRVTNKGKYFICDGSEFFVILSHPILSRHEYIIKLLYNGVYECLDWLDENSENGDNTGIKLDYIITQFPMSETQEIKSTTTFTHSQYRKLEKTDNSTFTMNEVVGMFKRDHRLIPNIICLNEEILKKIINNHFDSYDPNLRGAYITIKSFRGLTAYDYTFYDYENDNRTGVVNYDIR